ncbi:MAG: hypothetical protein C0486_01475 [Erythrobacter sp.]|nr:hypothetical protein [Erythrobacter sp.]MBA4080305.1 hypothetical protein [Erythrobacter sp.]
MLNYTTDPTAPDTPAKLGLRAALARRRGKLAASAAPAPHKATGTANPAPVALAPKPKAKQSSALTASPEYRAETQRAIDVINSPHFAANRDLAITLYKNPRLSAAEITSMLALAGAGSATEENAALADMKAALAEARQRNGASAGTVESDPSKAADIWARAHAKVATEMGQ